MLIIEKSNEENKKSSIILPSRNNHSLQFDVGSSYWQLLTWYYTLYTIFFTYSMSLMSIQKLDFNDYRLFHYIDTLVYLIIHY